MAKNRLNKRIVGGTQAGDHAFPFAVYLSIETNPTWHAVCGGTLISDTHIVTAAHCVHHAHTLSVKIGLGHSTLNKQQRLVASNITTHPQFNIRTLANDIAIVHLSRPVTMTRYVHRIPVYFGHVNEGARVVAMGWGVTSNNVGARTSLRLNRVDLDVGTTRMCKQVDSEFVSSNGPFVCTSTHPTMRDECNGDSGAPVVIDTQDTRRHTWTRRMSDWNLVALTSYGDTKHHETHPMCGDSDGVGFGTHVAHYAQFIHSATGLERMHLEAPVRFDRHGMYNSGQLSVPLAAWLHFIAAIVAIALVAKGHTFS
ncbi:Transmembrane protease serine 11D [Coemansia sp. RSA 1824]|nr:Transmembrane protease serine 11D [Coemansia sp. RSA 1752]KAJ1779219.1 Transmembrane protease serine 11D [Coemansia sp. RSA 1824]